MKKKKKSNEIDPMDLRYRRRNRARRERRIKWLLTAAAILIIILIAILFRRIALERFGGNYKAPIENPTYWFEQTQIVAFSTATPTVTMTPTPTIPTPTFTATVTPTATISPTPTLTPTPKLRPRKTVEGIAADTLGLAESTRVALFEAEKPEVPTGNSESWFELLGKMTSFDASEIYPNADCTWMGAAGILVDKRGDPQIGYYVQIGFADGSVAETISGLFPDYGESGYELTIARPVVQFDSPIWIRILDEDRLPASEQIYFRPSSDCAKSLTMINFQRIR